MTVLNWILLSCAAVFLGIYIFSSIKKLNVVRKISGCAVLPLLVIVNILFLLNYLPDSKYIVCFSLIAMFFSVSAEIFYVFNEKPWCQKLLKVSVFLISFIFSQLYKSILFIIDVPAWFAVVFLSSYVVILVFVFMFSERKKLLQYISFSFVYLQTALLNFFSLVYLCFIPRLQSVLLFSGAFLFLILVCFYCIFGSKKEFKLQNLFCFILFLISQSLIIYSNIFLINQ